MTGTIKHLFGSIHIDGAMLLVTVLIVGTDGQ